MITTTRDNTEKLHWSFWLGVAFFVAVVVGLLSFAYVLLDKTQTDDVAPVTRLSVHGIMPYTQAREIQQALVKVNLSNFFKVDVNQVQKQIEQLPWVYSVSVRKQWPNQLQLHIVDQTPVAIWNGDFLINQQGQAFQAPIARVKQVLPHFYGPEGSEQLALTSFTDLTQLLQFKQLAIQELELSERFAWQLTLTNGVTLKLGREDRVARVQRYMDSLQQIEQATPAKEQVDYVDLRYDTGLAVGWKQQENKRV